MVVFQGAARSAVARFWRIAALVGISALVPATAVVAQAPPPELPVPAQCSAKSRTLERYKLGVSTGTQRADAFFAPSDVAKDPKKLKNKLSRVFDRLLDVLRTAMASDTTDGRRCRMQGIADGFLSRLAQLLGQCVFDGGQWAQFASNLYCDLSVEFGGLGSVGQFYRAPAGLCGSLFERVCDNGYAYVATEGKVALQPAVQQFLQSRGLTLQPYPGCLPYTEPPFDRVFAESLNLDCSYNPP